MFASVLVANRGEIAVRVIRTLRELGVRSALVTSVPDRHSRAARRADATVLLEGHTTAETYLDIEAVIAAAKAEGCEAVHPGYGFLSESAAFAEACAAAGLAFIGPSPTALRILGDKIAARDLAIANDVPVIPGASGESEAELIAAAAEIGLPVMVKARGGGGGMGMRVVREGDDLAEAIAGARRQAGAAFGDGRVFIERYVEEAHHVEVQILSDAHGNAVHLGERDCSVQRRHQKLIEEAPSPIVDSALRAELTSAALRLMEAAGYVNAGTVEFLVGAPEERGRRPFYFLEVNPRLQVEHPVTEAVTSLDLVAEQLRIAAGEPLGFAQEDVAFGGHAIEFRLNAEDPWHNFLPSPGRLVDLSGGTATAARLDSGYEAGDTVPAEYDSLVAKLIVRGSDREAALSGATAELAGARIEGIASNLALHRAIVSHPSFVAGAATIQWLERELPALLDAARPPPEALVAAALLLLEEEGLGFGGSAWLGAGPRSVWLDDGAGVRVVSIARDGAAVVEGEPVSYARAVAKAGRPVALIGGTGTKVDAVRECSGQILLDCGAAIFGVRLAPPPPLPPRAQAAVGGASEVRAPLAGRVLVVHVAEGETVPAGTVLVVLDAMKMEHAITAPAAGTVRAVHVRPDQTVGSGALLVELD